MQVAINKNAKINDLVAEHITNMKHLLPGSPFWCKPSTEIQYAWEVVRKMQLKGFHSSHTDLSEDSGQEWWSWHFTKGNDSYSAQAESAPMAICLAALKAVGVELEE